MASAGLDGYSSNYAALCCAILNLLSVTLYCIRDYEIIWEFFPTWERGLLNPIFLPFSFGMPKSF